MNISLPGFGGRISFLCAFVAVTWVLPTYGASESREYDLSLAAKPSQRVKVTLQVEGKLKLLGADRKERQLPLKVSGNFQYDERVETDPTLWASRYYHTAEAEISLDKNTHKPTLDRARALVGMKMDQDGPRFWSPGGPLLRDEAELIELHGSSVLLPGLLPAKPVKVGDTWAPDEATLAPFLVLDALSNSKIECKLAEIKDGRAVVEMAGKVSGAVEGVGSEIELSAKYAFHLTERRFTSMAMALKESRAIGQAEPGFDVTARLTMTLTSLAASEQLTDVVVASIAKGVGAAPPLQYESAEHGVRFLLDPRWRVIMDRNEVAVLRFIDAGDVVAQCNVSSLPPLASGRQLQLEEFQQDIKKALAENFGQFVEATQTTTDSGLRVMRVTVAGEASELPIHWIYYHVSNDDGRRVSYVFTMETDMATRFAGADAQFTASLELFTPAPAAQSASEPAAKEAQSNRRTAK
jgi:hypothetical protein